MKAWIHLFRVNKELGFTQEYVLGGWKNVFSDVDSSTKGGGNEILVGVKKIIFPN